MKRTLCAVGLALCLTWAAPAGAVVLCTKKSGVVVVRATCRKRETPLNLTQFGAVGPKGDKGAPGGLLVPCATQVGTDVFFTGCNVNIRVAVGAPTARPTAWGTSLSGTMRRESPWPRKAGEAQSRSCL